MKEKGKVIEIKGDKAVVLMEKTEKCQKCGLCKKIVERGLTLEAENNIGAKVGDEVEIEVKEEDIFKISVFIFGFPFFGFILGIIFSSFVKIQLLKIFSVLFFLFLFWYIGFKIAGKYTQNKKPEIVDKV